MKYISALLSLVFVWVAACVMMDPVDFIQNPSATHIFEKPQKNHITQDVKVTDLRAEPLSRFGAKRTRKLTASQSVQQSASLKMRFQPTRIYSNAAFTNVVSELSVATAPQACIGAEQQQGFPVKTRARGNIQLPNRVIRQDVKGFDVRKTEEGYVCATFLYQVDHKGRLVNIEPVHVSDDTFSAKAYAALKQWKYEPGAIGETPTTFSGYSAVFYQSL